MSGTNGKRIALGIGAVGVAVAIWLLWSMQQGADAPTDIVASQQELPAEDDAPARDTNTVIVTAEPAETTPPSDEADEAPSTTTAEVPGADLLPAVPVEEEPVTPPAARVLQTDEADETVPAEETEVASADAPETEAPAEEAADETAPTFDLVRVEPDGSTVIAGRAEPGTEVNVTADGEVIGTAIAGSGGEFVALVDTPQTGLAQELRLETEGADGNTSRSEETVIVLVEPEAETEEDPAPPVVLLSTPEATEVLQAPDPGPSDQIVLDAISYSNTGGVVLSGRGTPGASARIYANGRPVSFTSIGADGTWSVVVETLTTGNYTLRVDELAADGSVTSRAESPFRREEPELVAAAQTEASTAFQQIVVQPGNNLWTIARERYGDGFLYTQIFTANADQIRNPDLIYPGQIFTLPED
ncbi:Ig-like domain-containing protein [Pontivivens ytuae]|uniref:LysM peptidoglycan-binding domain-containing protein n=1 Tax=Pontivivens ytuae TaxID=2789856 RepID=A0A7S9LS82_9RHOB|nr:Ig-like domain-containing protein [Pontivivens ytuae]QPH54339.1 LysM peptidoglycan-binding domain-containing protein [Pontivivens ytuae]